METITAAITLMNDELVIDDELTCIDHITIYRDGEPVTEVTVPSTEDPEPYDAAIRAAGFETFTWER